MISNALPPTPRSRTAASAPRRHTSARPANSSPIKRRRISVTSFALCSTKTARSAPWRRASIPNAPEPAYKSSTPAPPTRPRRLLRTASRTRASVGRNSSRRRPRTALPFASIAGLADGHRGPLDEPAAHLPLERRVLAAGQVWIIGQQPARFVASQLQDRDVGQRVGDAQIRQPVLARAQDLPRPPQFQIPLRDDESIVRARHRLHPLTGGIGRQRTEQDTVGRLRAPPYSAAQLVKLGEPEPVGILDHHDRRLRHVDPDLDHRRRHQDFRRAPPERVHDLLFLLRAHSTVQHTQRDVAEHLLAEALGQTNGGFDLKLLGFFDQRADDVCLPPRAYLFANPRVHLRAFLRTAHVGPHGTPPGGHFVEDRNVQITVESHGQGPWNRRRRHDQDVWVESLSPECGPLRDSKLVLLVHHHQP